MARADRAMVRITWQCLAGLVFHYSLQLWK
jgi:hypothetical protein